MTMCFYLGLNTYSAEQHSVLSRVVRHAEDWEL